MLRWAKCFIILFTNIFPAWIIRNNDIVQNSVHSSHLLDHRGKQENDELILLELLHQNLNWYVNMRCLSWNWKCSSPNERILTIGLLMARHTFASISASSWWWEFSLTVEAQSSHQNDDEDYAASPHAMQSQVFNKLTRFSPVIWNKLIIFSSASNAVEMLTNDLHFIFTFEYANDGT